MAGKVWRPMLSLDVINALEDALAYYLSASAENFGSGEYDEEVFETRRHVLRFMRQTEAARGRLEAGV